MHKKQWICVIVALTVLLGMLCFAGCRREDPTQPALDSKPAPTQDQTQSQIPTEPASKELTEPAPEGPTAEVTDPTEPTQEPTNRETRPTEPENSSGAPTNAPTAVPTEPPTETPTDAPSVQPTDPPGVGVGFGAYLEMSEEEQEAFFNSFAQPQDFFDWLNAAQKEYEDTKDQIEVNGDETFDLGNLS